MKHITILLTGAAMAITLASCGGKSDTPVLRTQQDTLSYAMGMSLAETCQSGIYDFDQEVMFSALKAAIEGKDPLLSRQEYEEACGYLAYLTTMAHHQQNQQATADADKAQEEYFAQLVKDNPNVKKSPDGYYYEVLVPGSGRTASANHRISFNFKSFEMLSGKPLIDSYEDGEPIVHNLSSNIFKGLYLGFQTMRAGSKYRFYFPYQLTQGVPDIPDHTPVIYEVELYEILNN